MDRAFADGEGGFVDRCAHRGVGVDRTVDVLNVAVGAKLNFPTLLARPAPSLTPSLWVQCPNTELVGDRSLSNRLLLGGAAARVLCRVIPSLTGRETRATTKAMNEGGPDGFDQMPGGFTSRVDSQRCAGRTGGCQFRYHLRGACIGRKQVPGSNRAWRMPCAPLRRSRRRSFS